MIPIRGPTTISGVLRAGAQLKWRDIERQAVVRDGDAERLAQPSGSGTQQPLFAQAAPPPHRREAFGRLQRADEHRGRAAFAFADEVDAPVDAVGAVDVGEARRAEHHGVARRHPAIAVRGRLGVVIGLELDDDAAHAVEQQRRANQFGRDLVHAAGKELPAKLFRHEMIVAANAPRSLAERSRSH